MDEYNSDRDPRDSPVDPSKTSKYNSKLIRNLVGFMLLGLTNNFAYVIMLSAAHDILKDDSSNAILLADILPTLIVKLTAPFFLHLVPYSVKVATVVGFAAASFPIVSQAGTKRVWLSLTGVVCASISAGLGEITFLSLSSFFDKNTVSTWSSGTGAAGLFGALSYAGLTAAGLSPANTLLVMLVIPALMAVSYYVILVKPRELKELCSHEHSSDSVHLLSESPSPGVSRSSVKDLTFFERFLLIKPLLKLMIPLGLVYYAEYFINQALFELVYFENIWLPIEQQYRWYQVIYQMGVFISRSSVNLVQIRKTWILSILQFMNVAVFILQIFFGFVPTIWLIFILILFEGLLGGAAYVNTFYRISQEAEPEYREFSMGVASMADSTGITISAITSIPIHNLFCSL